MGELKGWGTRPRVTAEQPCRKQTCRGAKEAAAAAPGGGDLVPAWGKVASSSGAAGGHSPCPRMGRGHPWGEAQLLDLSHPGTLDLSRAGAAALTPARVKMNFHSAQFAPRLH